MKIDIHKNVNCAPFVRQYVILETNGVLYHAKRENVSVKTVGDLSGKNASAKL